MAQAARLQGLAEPFHADDEAVFSFTNFNDYFLVKPQFFDVDQECVARTIEWAIGFSHDGRTAVKRERELLKSGKVRQFPCKNGVMHVIDHFDFNVGFVVIHLAHLREDGVKDVEIAILRFPRVLRLEDLGGRTAPFHAIQPALDGVRTGKREEPCVIGREVNSPVRLEARRQPSK